MRAIPTDFKTDYPVWKTKAAWMSPSEYITASATGPLCCAVIRGYEKHPTETSPASCFCGSMRCQGDDLVYTIWKMTQEEAKELGFEQGDSWRYVRVDSVSSTSLPLRQRPHGVDERHQIKWCPRLNRLDLIARRGSDAGISQGTPASRKLPEITKKQAEKIVNTWMEEGLCNVPFQDDRSRPRQGLALCE